MTDQTEQPEKLDDPINEMLTRRDYEVGRWERQAALDTPLNTRPTGVNGGYRSRRYHNNEGWRSDANRPTPNPDDTPPAA